MSTQTQTEAKDKVTTTLASLIGSKKKSNSTKNPQFYNNERRLFITEMCQSEVAAVRLACASNVHVPQKILIALLSTETDIAVIRAALLNPCMTAAGRMEFITTCRTDVGEELTKDTAFVSEIKVLLG